MHWLTSMVRPCTDCFKMGASERNNLLPKSTHQERIISNFDVFDFELSEGDMNAINELNKNEKHGSDPETFNF